MRTQRRAGNLLQKPTASITIELFQLYREEIAVCTTALHQQSLVRPSSGKLMEWNQVLPLVSVVWQRSSMRSASCLCRLTSADLQSYTQAAGGEDHSTKVPPSAHHTVSHTIYSRTHIRRFNILSLRLHDFCWVPTMFVTGYSYSQKHDYWTPVRWLGWL